MLREIAQMLLSGASVVAAFFVSPDSANFSFIQMCVVLIMIIIVALICWSIPEFFHRNKKF
ncbi:MAG: Hypothetical protein BHV28_03200 [Candidatus Tokpelaia hoelldobleri]|uniref:Uncharacterized protein n=1 Tax=Candidatus Tokpelaia hoelldobleri TaxID=1902579 RepID=A0A1U9JT47_9HYPH|nr:MAG: Hypothetical protein BHV28_03200 [Candidatus Tokpelaia hoelldoblerii]